MQNLICIWSKGGVKKKMKYSAKQLIILSAQERNILPITSACNLNCLFCSHQFNPDEVKVFNIGHQSIEEIKETTKFLTPNRKIVIGESVTRIIEGEPFAQPRIKEILTYLRNCFPETMIQITTNGSYLTEKNIKLLSDLGLFELNLSLNSAQPELRKRLMGDNEGDEVLNGIKDLAKYQVPYHGSIVAMPMISGWDDIEETVRFLNQNKARTIRIFLPGYTKLTPSKLQFNLDLWERLIVFTEELNNKYQVPIIVEPPSIDNLEAILQGVINDSLAEIAGLQKNDNILEVNQQPVVTRVETFNLLLNAESPLVRYERSDKIKEVQLHKQSGERSGIVLDYDISLERLKKIRKRIIANSTREVLIFTSTFGNKVVELGIKEVMSDLLDDVKIKVIAVKNNFFGGSIMAAGLLVVDDFLDAIYEYQNEILEADLIFIPENPFDNWGYDLVGKSYEVINNELDCEVVLV